MKIHSLAYSDEARNWGLNPIQFRGLTLLVGASGVGKTQILRSIMRLQQVSNGKSLNGISWKIDFSTVDDIRYVWEGEFENRGIDFEPIFLNLVSDEDDESQDAPKILHEHLYRNGVEIISRYKQTIKFEGKPTVKLPQEKSALHLLKEEDLILPAYQGFQKIILDDSTRHGNISIVANDLDISVEEYPDIKSIRNSEMSIRARLYLTSCNVPDIFDRIRDQFVDIFPFVEDIKIAPTTSKKASSHFQNVPVIQIKEYNVSQWIDERFISSGMSKTLKQIGNLYLSAIGTVILVDEFENSLGVNCIDEVTEMFSQNHDLQFIITSHHPYIINNVEYKNWKLISRKAGVVTGHDASDFNLGKSKHEAFTQLINLDIYTDGAGA